MIGSLSGFIVVRLKVNTLTTTLGIASILAAVRIVITDKQQPRPPAITSWDNFAQTSVSGFQIVALYMFIIAAILWWALVHTPVTKASAGAWFVKMLRPCHRTRLDMSTSPPPWCHSVHVPTPRRARPSTLIPDTQGPRETHVRQHVAGSDQ